MAMVMAMAMAKVMMSSSLEDRKNSFGGAKHGPARGHRQILPRAGLSAARPGARARHWPNGLCRSSP
eukprot:5227297-Pyramimonas_sp.AAC.1